MDDTTKLERGPMVGRMLEGDFEKDTITFHMPATYYLASGRYIIEPESDWVRRKEQLPALSARASAGEGGEWVLVPMDAITAAAAELSAQGCKDSASDLLQSMIDADTAMQGDDDNHEYRREHDRANLER